MLSSIRHTLKPILSTIVNNQLPRTSAALPSLFSVPSRWAGHSHWQNVLHVKQAKDKEKAKTMEATVRNINRAIKGGGGSRDPVVNSQLASAIKQARSLGVPQNSITRVLSADFFIDPYIIELRALGGIFVLVESCNKHAIKERQQIRSISKKYSCELIDGVSGRITKEFFNHDGFVVCNADDKVLSCLDSATELGIELGVQDVEEITSEQETFYQFQCAISEVTTLQEALENQGVSVLEGEDRFTPKQPVQVTSDTQILLQKMYDRFYNELETVSRIFDNVEVIEEDNTSSKAAKKGA